MKKRIFVLACLMATVSITSAGIVYPYGDFVDTNVQWLGVQETISDDTWTGTEGWYGAPVAGGDSLFFTCNDFSVLAGPGADLDYKDSKLEFSVLANAGKDIDSLEVYEGGAYSLAGSGTEATYAKIFAGGLFTINSIVTADDDVVVINKTVPVEMTYKKAITGSPVDDGKFDMVNDGPADELWEGELEINIDQLIVDLYNAGEISVLGKASEVYLALDNKLTAVSESGSLSAIDKKSAGVEITVIPEPATMVLLGLGGLLLRKRK